MTEREKMIELLSVTSLEMGYAVTLADHLIANGVTIQKHDGCEYCKEDAEGYRKMIGALSITNPFHGCVWQIETAHCKPRQIFFCPMCGRKLQTPPKEDK